MVIKPEESPNQGIKKYIGKLFADLNAGDRETVVAEITQIKIDEKNTPPQWFLYYLFDGATTIRAFGKAPTGLEVGDIVMVDLGVRAGKPFNGKPQLNYSTMLVTCKPHT